MEVEADMWLRPWKMGGEVDKRTGEKRRAGERGEMQG
jgi:hypothetical protein